MSKIAQIEAELSTKEGGIFQRICNYYLFRKYDISPTESGGAKGKDKTKPGTPDSFMVLQNGNFIFVEHSTGEKGLYSKFKEDLEEKCFNEEKTEVPISKIEKVILCYNTKLSPSDTSKLVEICKNRKVEIIFLDLNKLSNEIFSYPRLSQGLLDIETDTEQILKPLDFTEELEHQGTSQTNQFVGRMTEQKDLGLALESEDLIIVSGKAGLGKTRLITEVMNDFKRKNNDYEIYCIKTKSQPIYNDLKAYFLPSRSYIVLVDDANRIGELSNIFHLIRDKRFNIKMIVTVRDYALNKIKAILEQEKYPYFPFILKPLNYEAIREILLSLKINTRSCVDKIVEIANGNPRLVLMSADFVLENGDCRNLKDVTDIYNSFYGHFLTREDFKSREFLTTLGIICFFRSFGKNKNEFDQNNDFNQKVYSIFNISEAEFWKQMQILHELELVDMYEEKIVKISDQVLANYFFHYSFLDKKILSFYSLLKFYFDSYPRKIEDNLLPIVEHFDSKKIIATITGDLEKYQSDIIGDDEKLTAFYKIFGTFLPEDTLSFINSKIELIPVQETKEFIFKKKKKNRNDDWKIEKEYPLFFLLKNFGLHPNQYFETSLEILFKLILREPELVVEVAIYIEEDLSYKYDSPASLYDAQLRVLKFIYKTLKQNSSQKIFYTKLLLEVGDTFLKSLPLRELKDNSPTNDNCLLTTNAKELRQELIFLLFDFCKEGYIDDFFSFFKNYGDWTFSKQLRSSYEFDKQFFIPFIHENFQSTNFQHCLLVNRYYDILHSLDITGDEITNLSEKFKSRQFLLYKEFTYERNEWRELNKDSHRPEDFILFNQQRLGILFQNYNLHDYFQLIDDIRVFQKHPQRKNYLLLQYLDSVLANLLKKSPADCIALLRYIFSNGNSIKLVSFRIIHNLLICVPKKDVFELISEQEYELKNNWLLDFYENISEEEISKTDSTGLLSVLEKFDSTLFLRLGFFEKYKGIEPKIYQKSMGILLDKKAQKNINFELHTGDLFEKYLSEFDDDFRIIKKAYIYFSLNRKFISNREDEYFKLIYQKDKSFLYEYIESVIENNQRVRKGDIKIDFSFLWKYHDAETVVDRIFTILLDKKAYSLTEQIMKTLFPAKAHSNKIKQYLKNSIILYKSDKSRLDIIFQVIHKRYWQDKLYFLEILLLQDIPLDVFTPLPFFGGSRFRMIGGSWVPHHERDIQFWQSLLPLLGGIKYLQHLKWVNQRISYLKKRKSKEKEKDFLRDF